MAHWTVDTVNREKVQVLTSNLQGEKRETGF